MLIIGLVHDLNFVGCIYGFDINDKGDGIENGPAQHASRRDAEGSHRLWKSHAARNLNYESSQELLRV